MSLQTSSTGDSTRKLACSPRSADAEEAAKSWTLLASARVDGIQPVWEELPFDSNSSISAATITKIILHRRTKWHSPRRCEAKKCYGRKKILPQTKIRRGWSTIAYESHMKSTTMCSVQQLLPQSIFQRLRWKLTSTTLVRQYHVYKILCYTYYSTRSVSQRPHENEQNTCYRASKTIVNVDNTDDDAWTYYFQRLPPITDRPHNRLLPPQDQL